MQKNIFKKHAMYKCCIIMDDKAAFLSCLIWSNNFLSSKILIYKLELVGIEPIFIKYDNRSSMTLPQSQPIQTFKLNILFKVWSVEYHIENHGILSWNSWNDKLALVDKLSGITLPKCSINQQIWNTKLKIWKIYLNLEL